MQIYKNLGGDSGVESYEIGTDYIMVEFKKTVRLYTYSYASAGKEAVELMKVMAKNGEGLNEYINKYVRDKYVK
ncbi:MAG: hypothetical protein IKL04_03750 [Lachnospiraceae bacterium]|nr:hypothetical protein [Lachnospiraceae bacterium]